MSIFPGAIPPAGVAIPTDSLAVAGHTALHNAHSNEIRELATKMGTGSSVPAAGLFLKGTGSGSSAWGGLELTATILDALWPVGSVYINANVSTNPATLLGIGTWVAWGVGKAIVGIDTSQTEFDTAEETGGAKTHTLTAAEMPSHTHVQDAHLHTLGIPTGTSGTFGLVDSATASSSGQRNTSSVTATNQNTGGGGSHNNLQPYQVGYVWKRTA